MGVPQTHLLDVLVPLNNGVWPPDSFDTFARLVMEAYPGGVDGPYEHGLKNIFCYASSLQPRMRAEITFATGLFVKMPSCNVVGGDVHGALCAFAAHLWDLPGMLQCTPGSTLPPSSSLFSSAASSSVIAPSPISHCAPAPSATASELASLRSLCAEQAAAIAHMRELVMAHTAQIMQLTESIAALQGQVVDETSTLGGGTTCSICFMGTKSHLALPCGHLFACGDCAAALAEKGQPCPMCRGATREFIQVHFC